MKIPTTMTNQQLIKHMTHIIRLLPIAVLILVGSRLEAKPAELVFTYWGSSFERQAVKKVIQQFNQQHANIRVRAQHIPNSNYTTKLATMAAAGTAPDIAGEGKANPLAMILSFAMMLRYSFEMLTEANQIEKAVETVLNLGLRTEDIMSDGNENVSTTEMGSAVIAELDKIK